MSETEETGGPGRPAAEVRSKGARRRRRRRPLAIRYWWVLPLVALVAAAPAIWNRMFNPRASLPPLPGYLTDTGKVEEEYRNFTGKPLDPTTAGQFDQATELMRQGNYTSAAIVLEGAARDIPVPAVFNDLGVLCWKLKDGPRALKAFRDALARDHDYAPVRANLKSIHMADAIDPGAGELEPNNDNSQANAVWLDRPVNGTIAASMADVDCFWFTTPRPPRDRISITVSAQSATLIPRIRIYDDHSSMVTGLKEALAPGASLRYDFSPPPNTLYYLQVDGASGSSGAYTVIVSALHAYDVYEPNDTILTATRIALGQTINANIMDGADDDFYSFVSPVAASVSIEVVSRSNDLYLGLETFAPDLHSIGFAPDPKSPAGSIHAAMQLEANQLYYVQVFSKNNTTGPYTLVVK